MAINLVFVLWSCKKNEQLAPKTNYISFIQNNTDTLRFDSTSNISATYNIWNNTFYSRDPINDYTSMMSDTFKMPSILINFPGRSTGHFDQLLQKSFVRYIDAKGRIYTGILGAYDIWVTAYGDIGSQVRGEFTAVLKQTNLMSTVTFKSGSFSVKRKNDFPTIK